jgi:AraC-like DNA-binding protein
MVLPVAVCSALETGPEVVMAPDGSPIAVDPVHVVTGDAAVASEVFRHGFPRLGLRTTRDRPGFRFDYLRVTDGRLAANRLRLIGAVEARGAMTPVVAAARLRSGRVDLQYGRTVVDTSAPYLRPAGESVVVMDDADVEMVELDPAAFALAASRLLEGSGRVLVQPSPLRAGPAVPELVPAWQHLSDYVLTVASDPAAFASPLVRAGLFDLVVSGFLATFPLTAERSSAGGTDVQPAAIRRALAYIDEHLADPIEVVEIAAAARVSVRALHAAFRRHLGVTPMEQVLNRRLEAVRQELVRADGPVDVTVAEVARRWGFAHLSRFAARYRAAYRENPSETLRR